MSRLPVRLGVPGFSTLERDHVLPDARIDRAEIDRHRDQLAAAAQPLLTAALGTMLVLSSFFRLSPVDSGTGLLCAGIAAVSGGVLLAAAIGLARRSGHVAGNVHATTLVVLVGTAVALAAVMFVSEALAHTAYFELVIVLAGAAMLRLGWYVAALAGIWSVWLGTAAVLSGTTDSAGWMLAMTGATVISIVVHAMRSDSLRALGGALVAAEAESVRDPLTGLLNRRGLEVVGDELLALARRSREPVACTIVDVDGLAALNERFGPESGDAVLMAVAEALGGVFRSADIVARWDGDEFSVLAIGAGPRVEEIERRLGDRLSAIALPYSPNGETMANPFLWSVDVTAGRVVHLPWQEEALEDITGRAQAELDRRRRVRRARAGDNPVLP